MLLFIIQRCSLTRWFLVARQAAHFPDGRARDPVDFYPRRSRYDSRELPAEHSHNGVCRCAASVSTEKREMIHRSFCKSRGARITRREVGILTGMGERFKPGVDGILLLSFSSLFCFLRVRLPLTPASRLEAGNFSEHRVSTAVATIAAPLFTQDDVPTDIDTNTIRTTVVHCAVARVTHFTSVVLGSRPSHSDLSRV